jgi:hypothetical protein
LAASQASARVIDQVLYGLNSVSALTGIEYDPETPLAESIGDVSESLDSLPKSFDAIEDDMATAQANLVAVEEGATSLATNLADIGTSLLQAQDVIDKYRTVVGRLATSIDNLDQKLAATMQGIVWGISFLLLWLIISQIGLVFQGWEMVAWERQRQPIPDEILQPPANASQVEPVEEEAVPPADQPEPEAPPTEPTAENGSAPGVTPESEQEQPEV